MKHLRKLIPLFTVIAILLVIFIIWKIARINSPVPFSVEQTLPTITYEDNEGAMIAISLSNLVYGCERCDDLSGTINDILDNNVMGIFEVNDSIVRTNSENPTTSLFDSTEFVQRYVGDYRFLLDLRDEKSGFYGAAFCDDEHKCIWIAYSGTVTTSDTLACVSMVLKPGLSQQESLALQLLQSALESDEVINQSYGIILTGHSLGGALATLGSLACNCPAITINGADGIIIDKMDDLIGDSVHDNLVTNYMTTPKESTLSMKNCVQRLMFLGSYQDVDCHVYEANGCTTDTHCYYSFIVFPDGDYTNPRLP